MKAGDLRDLTIEELKLKENELRHEIFNLRFQHSTNQLENTAKIRSVKRDIARIKTVIKEKYLQSD